MNEDYALEAAKNLADEINKGMTLLPGYRIQSHGTRISIQPSGGHYYDAGLDCVAEFNKVFDIPIATDPAVPFMGEYAIRMIEEYKGVVASWGRHLKLIAQVALDQGDEGGALMLIRLQLCQEELAELAEAIIEKDIVACLDALTDMTYVADGTYLAFGLGHYKLAALAEVHRSNMSKLGADGKPEMSSAGRIKKGPNYSPPDLMSVLMTSPARHIVVMNHQLSTNPFAKTLLERKIRDVDEAAIREFKNDLKNMTVDDMERELRHVEEQIDDLEPWQEALKAALRSPDKLAKVLKK
jgi:hypothetical protein